MTEYPRPYRPYQYEVSGLQPKGLQFDNSWEVSGPMSQIQRLALALVLLPVGFIAGTDVFELMGNMPAVRRMPLDVHVSSWQALDYYMEPRMPLLVTSMFLLFLFAIFCFRKQRGALFWALIACFGLELAASAFTVMQQIPINRAVAALDPAHLSDPGAVEQLRDATLRHFNLLALLCISAFVWLLFVTIFSIGSTPLPTKRTEVLSDSLR